MAGFLMQRGWEALRMPSGKTASSRALPFVVRADSAHTIDGLAALLRTEHARLDALLRHHGALLFRGFGAREPDDLACAIAAAGAVTMPYAGGTSPRVQHGGAVYSERELPRSATVVLHNELSYLSAHPGHLWLACVEPAAEGGETTLADGRAVFHELDRAVRRRFVERGVRYACTFGGESPWSSLLDHVARATDSWMQAFETTDPQLAEERCRMLGAHTRWLPSGRLMMETSRPAVVTHPETGETAWFNAAHVFRHTARGLGWLRYLLSQILFPDPEAPSQDARFGDGTEIDPETLAHVFDVMDARTEAVAWERGDVLWIDNLLCMHGRNPYRGERRLLAAMTR